jgi:cytochrome d ubiquinol oxidase subunit II
MAIILVGLVLYVVLGGADFGAPVWQVLAGKGPHTEDIREHAHDSMAPVWEANHVWLIFVLTVMWTAFPVALGSLASTLCVPLFLAGIGIILRGAAYALRAGTSSPAQVKAIDMVSAASSVLAPFALGAAVGGIASGRVPVGNAGGDLITSWVNPTSITIGVLAVVSSAYLAAVFLAADAVRRDEPDLAREFRRRALVTGALAGVLAIAGLVVLRGDARPLFDELVGGAGLPGLIVSVLAGALTVLLLWRGRHEAARYTSALAVAAIVAGWALAQNPVILPGLTIEQAAAPHDTLVATLVAIVAGGAILFPSLALLFRLVLGGRLGHGAEETAEPGPRRVLSASSDGLQARVAIACAVAGFGFLTVAEAGWAHAIGVTALLAAIVLGFLATIPALLAE